MKRVRIVPSMMMFLSSATLLQFGGCVPIPLLDIANTVFLGITAAGSLAILRNL